MVGGGKDQTVFWPNPRGGLAGYRHARPGIPARDLPGGCGGIDHDRNGDLCLGLILGT
jgi:hypothetical protein